MEHTHASPSVQAEDLLRLLAGAVNAVRLYPSSSPIRAEAIARFTREANAFASAHGPVQYSVDRKRFLVFNSVVGEAYPQVSGLAESLHALQVGQVILAPGMTEVEVLAFLGVIGGDAATVRASGGARAAVLNAGVENIAIIEVSLKASEEEGILGLDLTIAPLEDIATELQSAAEAWAQAGPDGQDLVEEAINRLEPAARDLAMRRCAEALLLLDEETRTRMLSLAVPQGEAAGSMDGMLSVVAHMSPAALARLLRLTAESMGNTPDSLLGALELPPEIAAELSALLRPSLQSEQQRGVPAETDVSAIAEEVVAEDEADMLRVQSMVSATTGRAAAARGLATTVRMAKDRPTSDSVMAVAEAMRPAVQQAALAELAAAASFLRGLAGEPGVSTAVQTAQAALREATLLEACARSLADDPDANEARTLLEEAGNPGAEALVAVYLNSSEIQRSHLLPAVGAMIESIAPVAGRILRSGDVTAATAVLRLLASASSRRLAPTIAAGLEHLDVRVREGAVIALADSPGPESNQLLQKALGHWDPETRRIAAREIGRTRNEELLPSLLKIAGEVSLFERNYELKKEVLKSLEAIHSPRAVPVLKRLAGQPVALGKKNRELRYLARRVLESLE